MTASILAGTLAFAACASEEPADDAGAGGGGDGGDAVVTVNGTEPQNPLIPTDTNEVEGGKVVDLLFSRLVEYDAEGAVRNEVAESIETEDNQTYTITLEEGWTFSDGSPVTASSFVDAWSFGALLSNAQANIQFFSSIQGFSAEQDSPLTGLQVVDDRTFTVTLNQPESDFPQRLGYSAFSPLPEAAFQDMAAFGENPIGNGPYRLAGEGAWEHNVQIELVPNEEYQGERVPQNGGVTVRMYENLDAAYNDLLSGNLDVLDEVPASVFQTFEDELAGRAVNQPAAVNQTIGFPEYVPQLSGEAGRLRRQAISHAINREEITEAIFFGTRTPATDFSSPVIEGYSDSIPGSEVLEYDPDLAKELWAQADAIQPWEGTFTISTNTDADHQPWVDAVNNSLRNTLGIDAELEPYAQFSEFLDARDNQRITGAFRAGWQADYPSLANYLAPVFTTAAIGGSNDAWYSNPEFDDLVARSNTAASSDEAIQLLQQAEEILFRDLPQMPLWYQNATGGWAEGVDNVEFGWNSVPLLYNVTKG